MPASLPSKRDCFYIVEMLRSSLIDFDYTQPWAEKLIIEMDRAPGWLCDVATEKYQGDQIKAFLEFATSEPAEAAPDDLEKFYLACLWLRYERRELSWATFLQLAGEKLDPVGADWFCETPYHYLNVYEDAYFTPESEEETKRAYLHEQDLKPWIELARTLFAPFLAVRRAKKFEESRGVAGQ